MSPDRGRRSGPELEPGRADRWVVGLARALRAEGVGCTLPESLAARDSLEHLDLGDSLDVYFGLRAALLSDPADIPAFDRCFWAAWGTPGRARSAGRGERRRIRRTDEGGRREAGRRTGAGDPSVLERLSGRATPPSSRAGDRVAETSAYSPSEGLTRRSFASLDERGVRSLERILDRVALKLATRRTRRTRPARRGGRVDLRRSLRGAVRHEGELVRLARRVRREEKPRIVLLCDVSGSMERYSRFLLRFILALSRVDDVSAFAFSTRLLALRSARRPRWRRPSEALEALAARMEAWPGGTRIGGCLETFVEEHGRRLLGRKTVVVILSDGLDRGDPAPLERAMRALQRRARKVIWLNPLLGTPGYEPEARGMKAALPYVDEFAPGHSVEALRDLTRMIRL